jgi:hypothetical protein
MDIIGSQNEIYYILGNLVMYVLDHPTAVDTWRFINRRPLQRLRVPSTVTTIEGRLKQYNGWGSPQGLELLVHEAYEAWSY